MTKCKTCGQDIKIIQHIPEKTLEWGEVSDEEMNWHDAKEWCESKGAGWRLPTVVELLQAYHDKVDGFPGNSFWSSTEYDNNTAYAWYVNLYNGNTFNKNKTNSNYVRCVRP